MNSCKHEKVDDWATCLICRACGAVGRLTSSLRTQPLRLVWVRQDKSGKPQVVSVEEGEL